jgi:hypothetical protein
MFLHSAYGTPANFNRLPPDAYSIVKQHAAMARSQRDDAIPSCVIPGCRPSSGDAGPESILTIVIKDFGFAGFTRALE